MQYCRIIDGLTWWKVCTWITNVKYEYNSLIDQVHCGIELDLKNCEYDQL